MSGEERRKVLASFIKSNKQRRLTLALRAGWSTADDYQAYLENLTDDAERTIESTVTDKPTVYVIDIVDRSGSMTTDNKINAANEGVATGITDMQKNTDVNYIYSLLPFSSWDDVDFSVLNTPIDKVTFNRIEVQGLTALFDAIGYTFSKFKDKYENGEKVLINIYTDGGENNSYRFTSTKISKLIADNSENVTVTFIGTESDTKDMINYLKIDKSNTLSYDGTAEGLSKSISSTIDARNVYATNVSQGNDVRTGFYKEVVNK